GGNGRVVSKKGVEDRDGLRGAARSGEHRGELGAEERARIETDALAQEGFGARQVLEVHVGGSRREVRLLQPEGAQGERTLTLRGRPRIVLRVVGQRGEEVVG